jgi:nucleotide-binding universal stress UspA family protein
MRPIGDRTVNHYRDIIVVCTRYDHWDAHVDCAAALAADHQARLTGLYLRWPTVAVGALGMPEVVIDDMVRSIDADLEAAHKAEPAFQRVVGSGGATQATWLVAVGAPGSVLAYVGASQDLVVLEAPIDPNDETSLGFVESIVLDARAPCLIVPTTGSRGPHRFECIAIAWNESIEALRAVHSALPLLTRAKRVVLVNGKRREYLGRIQRRPKFDLDTYLHGHGVQVAQRWLEPEVKAGDGEALLAEVNQIGADLLVMGAYGHTRLREWMLGGVTRHVLRNAGPALLLQH